MKIFILKLWYVACAILCLYSLKAVVEERYDVTILAVNQSETDPITFLACKELSSFKIKQAEISLGDLRYQLVNHVNGSAVSQNYIEYKNLVMNRLETGQYLIFNGLFCIILKDESEEYPMFKILSRPVIYFAFRNSTLDFTPRSSFYKHDQLIVQKKGPPYSNCTETNDRFRCLNECFKNNFRLARYFYEGNETGLIHLKLAMNRTIEEREKSCLKKCWRENCKILQIIPFTFPKKPVTTKLEAEPKMNEFDFWVEFIGLVCSFANVSLDQLISLVIGFASSKVKRRKVRIALFCLKWAILFLSLILCGYLYITLFLGYKADERSPPTKKITRNFIKQKSVRLTICVDIEDYFKKYFTKGFDDDGFLIEYLDINNLKKAMSEIEKATDSALDDHLESIYLNYQEKMFKMDYIPEPKVLFRGFYSTDLYRCFPLLILPDYQLMPSNPKLTIKLKKGYGSKLFLLTKNENLNQKTFESPHEKAFIKRVVRRLKQTGRCVNYPEREGHCTGKMNCIENCINREALEKFKKIPIDNAVVDKDQFSLEEWSTSYPMKIPNSGLNSTIYVNVSSRCLKKFQDEPCEEIKFNKTVDIISLDPKTKGIDLYLDVELSIEEFTWFKLLLNILNIQSIFFSMTVLKLLKMLYSFFKPMLIIGNDKIATFFIYLLCSIGFTWHTYRIFDLSIQGELTYSPNYEIVDRVQMPVLVFCLPIKENLIDKNHQLTGNYLEQLTRKMTPASLFKNITYLNESSEWTSFNVVDQFFFMHLKCFNINIAQEYDRRHFHFSTNSQVLKVLRVNFTKKFVNQKRNPTFFMTKTNETGFSNVVNLIYGDIWTKYLAEQSELTVKYEDRFSLLKKFLFSTSYEDDFSDRDEQLSELKDSGLDFKTLKIPVKKRDFDCEIRDDLFEQLFARVKVEMTQRNSLASLDYQQKFISNQLKKILYYDNNYDSSFTFSLVLIKKTLSTKNEENFAKLMLNILLNVFCIWFDLGIIDLHPIFMLTHNYLLIYIYLHWPRYLFDKITQFLMFSHRWLKKFEEPLYKRLDSRKRSAPQTSQA